ncbi:MAG: bifunctional riboflavin kinase/FAD synthetase [Spirochaetia bacterium]|nr:bifunctional riboflavin kinase/FAD synthetase [Spirochaetia bacterium]
MVVFNNLHEIENIGYPGVITLGNFDGIHLGHRKIIQKCMEESARINGKCVVVTYDHQNSALFKGNPEFIYMNHEKINILENIGVDYLLLLPFSEEIKNITADEFLTGLLINKLNAQIIIIGYDHHFGKNREGDIDYLKKRAHHFGYSVIQIEPVLYENKIISSSRIRSDLVLGNIKHANAQMGLPYFISGQIVHGFNRGKLTGFPTANIKYSGKKLLPAEGVYLAEIYFSQNTFSGIVNIGYNPTFNNDKLSIEVHILNFRENLYGENITVYFLEKIREEMKFDNIDDLKRQINTDINFAKKYFKIQESNCQS